MDAAGLKRVDRRSVQLEAEGVGVATTDVNPLATVVIEPVQERLTYDITVPVTKPNLAHDARRLADLDVRVLEAIYDQEELAEPYRIRLKMEFSPTATEVHQEYMAAQEPPAQELNADVTNNVMQRVGLPDRFAELYPAVKEYVEQRCFGISVDIEVGGIRSHLSALGDPRKHRQVSRSSDRRAHRRATEDRVREHPSNFPRRSHSTGGATCRRYEPRRRFSTMWRPTTTSSASLRSF